MNLRRPIDFASSLDSTDKGERAIFSRNLFSDRPLLLDGATGTELTRRGVTTTLPEWSASALETHPEVIQAIHLDYLHAGADIITTNTFRTHARNIGNNAAVWTQRAVAIGRAAIEESRRQAWLAGSVAPLEDCYSPHLTPDATTCQREQRQMVENLAGVDVLLIETMNTIHEAQAAAQAAHDMQIPFMVSFVLDEHFNLLSGETLHAAVDTIAPLEPVALLVNCIPVRHIDAALQHLATLTTIPIGAYGNMGTPDDVVGWAASHEVSPTEHAHEAVDWLAHGAQIIGSCCGSTPEHIAALRQLIDKL